MCKQNDKIVQTTNIKESEEHIINRLDTAYDKIEKLEYRVVELENIIDSIKNSPMFNIKETGKFVVDPNMVIKELY